MKRREIRTAETFEIGDAVEYEDAYTGELKHGRITSMAGGNVVIRTITEKEAGRQEPEAAAEAAHRLQLREGPRRESHLQLSPRRTEPAGGSRRPAEPAGPWRLLRVNLPDDRQAGLRRWIFGVGMTVADAPGVSR